jgi:hypothetical protein
VPISGRPISGRQGACRPRAIEAVRGHQIIGSTPAGCRGGGHAVEPRDHACRSRSADGAGWPVWSAEPSNLAVTFDNELRTPHVEGADAELRVLRLAFEPRNAAWTTSNRPAAPRRAA